MNPKQLELFKHKILIIFNDFCSISKHLYIFPFQWNPIKLKLEPRPTKFVIWVFLYLNLFHNCLYTIYLWISAFLIWKGYVRSNSDIQSSPSSIVHPATHFVFAIYFSVGSVLSLFTFKYTEQLISAFNHVLGLAMDLQRKYATTNSSCHQNFYNNVWLIIILFTMCIQIVCPFALSTYCIRNPSNQRYFLWILIQSSNSYYYKIWSFLYSILHGCVTLFTLYNIAFYVLLFEFYIYNTLYWLNRINAISIIRKNQAVTNCHSITSAQLSSSFLIYRQLQILNQIAMSLTRPFLIPFIVFINYCLGITLNYLIFLHYHHYPLLMVLVGLLGSGICWAQIVFIYPMAATIHTSSMSFSWSWRNWIKSSKSSLIGLQQEDDYKYKFALIKSMTPIKIIIGHFILLQKSISYKFVLFMILQTMRALLLFRP